MTKLKTLFILAIVFVSTTLCRAEKAGTVFTYSGRLSERTGNTPAKGNFEMTFQLFDAETKGGAVSGLIVKSPVEVSNGIFSAEIDFGLAPFGTDDARWLEVGVRPIGSKDDFEIFSKRQRLNVVPYSIWAGAAFLAGTANVAIEANSLVIRNGQIKVPGAGVGSPTPVFIHQANPNNTQGHITTIDNPLCNGDGGAMLFVTHNWNADSSIERYETIPVGVFYDGNRWTIFHEDFTPMQNGRAYNVLIVKP